MQNQERIDWCENKWCKIGKVCYNVFMNDIEKYYNKFNEHKRLLSRHGQVEFFITTKYILKYINNRTNLKILDVGAGTGRYSNFLHELGHDVTAVEYVKKNLSVLQENYPQIKSMHGDARNLKKIKDDSFDITLLFGPMYHLFSVEDKLKVLNEAKRVTKKGGLIFIAYLMNEYAVITYAFKEGNLLQCLKDKKLSKDFKCLTSEKDLYSYVRLDEINKLNNLANLHREQIIAVDGATDYIRPVINKMTDEEFKIYLDYQMSICEKLELLGASSHCLDIVKNN